MKQIVCNIFTEKISDYWNRKCTAAFYPIGFISKRHQFFESVYMSIGRYIKETSSTLRTLHLVTKIFFYFYTFRSFTIFLFFYCHFFGRCGSSYARFLSSVSNGCSGHFSRQLMHKSRFYMMCVNNISVFLQFR